MSLCISTLIVASNLVILDHSSTFRSHLVYFNWYTCDHALCCASCYAGSSHNISAPSSHGFFRALRVAQLIKRNLDVFRFWALSKQRSIFSNFHFTLPPLWLQSSHLLPCVYHVSKISFRHLSFYVIVSVCSIWAFGETVMFTAFIGTIKSTYLKWHHQISVAYTCIP